MTKSKDQKTKKPRTWNEAIVEASNTYDGTNYVYDGADDTIMTESEMLKKFTAQEKYEMLKKVSNNQEKKEFRDIERKYKKKSSIETRTEQSKTPRGTDAAPLNIDFKFPKIEKEILTLLDDNKTLERLEADRKKVDPDFYKGLGTFFVKKF